MLNKINEYKVYILIPFLGVPVLFNSILISYRDSFLIYLGIILFFLFFSFKNIKKIPWEMIILFTLPLISLLYSNDTALSLQHYFFFFIYIALFVIFYKYEHKEKLYKVILFYSVILFLYILFQKFYIYPYLQNSTLLTENQMGVLEQNRYMATFSLPNIYSFFILTAIYVSYKMYKIKKNYLYLFLILINITALIFTKTFISFGLLLLMFLILLYRDKRKYFYYFSGLVLIMGIIFFSLRSISSVINSLNLRYLNYRTAYLIFKDNPIIGVGVNNFDLHYMAYKFKEANIIHNAHSMVLQSLADLGLIGILFIYFFIKIIYKQLNSKWIVYYIIISLYFFTDMMFYVPSVAILFWIILATNFKNNSKVYNYRIKTVCSYLIIIIYITLSLFHFTNPDRVFFNKIKSKMGYYKNNNKNYSLFITNYKLRKYFGNENSKK